MALFQCKINLKQVFFFIHLKANIMFKYKLMLAVIFIAIIVGNAHADVRVNFTSMHVNNCDERRNM